MRKQLIKRYQAGGKGNSSSGSSNSGKSSNNSSGSGSGSDFNFFSWGYDEDGDPIKWQLNLNKVGNYASMIGKLLPTNNSSQTNAYNLGYDAVSDALMATPAGWILKVAGLGSDIGYALGDKTDLVTAEDLFLDSKFSRITPGGLYNLATRDTALSLFGDLDTNMTFSKIGAAYGNVMSRYDQVKDKMGKVIGNAWGQLDRWNDKINKMNVLLAGMIPIALKLYLNELLMGQMLDRLNQYTFNDLNGGVGNISFGRLGLKVEILPRIHAILNKPKVVDTLSESEEVQEFKEGGKMNVIPEGSLHARLHHMENAEGLTKKGIPVVSIAEGGELEQLAEIELNEIIFNLDVTTELEKLMLDGSDNAAIEAGKLLVKEIFENTNDRTGLIKLLEPEKKESTTEDIVKNHQVFQEGGILPTLKTIEELVDYAIKLNPAFVLRIGPNMGYAEFTDKDGKKARGTHYLESVTDDRGNTLVYPRIQMKEGQLKDLGDKAWEEAKRNKNYLVFDNPRDAELFATKYKESKLWKLYFDIWNLRFGSFKNGGILEKINGLSPEQLEKLTKFLNEV